MSVLTVAIAAAAYVLIGPLDVGVTAMDQDMRIVLDDARPASTSGRREGSASAPQTPRVLLGCYSGHI